MCNDATGSQRYSLTHAELVGLRVALERNSHSIAVRTLRWKKDKKNEKEAKRKLKKALAKAAGDEG